MFKVYLAVGNEGVEKYIKSQKPLLEKMLNDTVNFVGVTVYKEGALQGIKDYHPDVIVLREGLQGNMDILSLIYKIRLESSNTRIIFITKTREVGDAFLATTVQMGVYDLIIGDKISVKDLLKKIVYPTKFIDVAHFIPKITVDERSSKTMFSAPDVDELVKQRVDEIMAQKEEEAAAAAAAANPEPVKVNPFKKMMGVDTGKNAMPAPLAEIPQQENIVENEPVSTPTVNLETEKNDVTYDIPKTVTPLPTMVDDEDEDESFTIEEETPVTQELKPQITPPIAVQVEKEPEPIKIVEEKLPEPPAPVVIEDDDFDEEVNLDTPAVIPNFGNTIQNSTFEDDEEDEELPAFVAPVLNPIMDKKPLPVEEDDEEFEMPSSIPEIPSIAPVIPPVVPPVAPAAEAAVAGLAAGAAIGAISGMMENDNSNSNRIPAQAMDEPVAPQQNPYVLEPLVKPQGHTEPKNTTSKKGFSLFKKKTTQKTVPAQIITFWGAGNGVGNSQIAFNSAISLANKGYHVLYVDLNDKFSAVESMMQLGFEDLGIDTMLNNIEQGKNDKVGHAISSIAKILPFTDKRDFLYKTYTNMPSSLNFAFFSQHCFERRTGIKYNVELIRELNMMWLMDYGYDIIILDAPADATNRLTQLALAYANKVFITLSQDKTVLSRMLKQMKYLSMQRISVREKSFYIVNKFENNAFSYNNLQNFISMNLEYENLELLSIPNLSKEFTNSIYNGTPIILSTKNKELLKTISDIVTLIES